MEKRVTMLLASMALSTAMAMAQTKVSGTILTAEGDPVVGASVLVVGTKTGTVTDVDGHYQMSIPAGSTLRISYLGLKTKTVKAKENQTVYLEADNTTLNDVVVTALGVSRQKKALGYAVTEVKGEDLNLSRGGLSNPVNALQGKIAGLQISSGAGSMGGSAKVLIRGANSLSRATTSRSSSSTVCPSRAVTTTARKQPEVPRATTTATSCRTSTPTTLRAFLY